MATKEYEDLYLYCQENSDKCKFHLFIFDIENSKQLMDSFSSDEIKKIRTIFYDIIKMTYKHIEILEKERNKKILVFEKDFYSANDENIPLHFGMKIEPILFADSVGFTIYNGSIEKEEVIQIFDYYKSKLNFEFNLHYNDGYYQTNDYTKGDKEYFRGYAIDHISNMHKKNEKIKEMI